MLTTILGITWPTSGYFQNISLGRWRIAKITICFYLTWRILVYKSQIAYSSTRISKSKWLPIMAAYCGYGNKPCYIWLLWTNVDIYMPKRVFNCFTHTHVHTHIYICKYIYIYICITNCGLNSQNMGMYGGFPGAIFKMLAMENDEKGEKPNWRFIITQLLFVRVSPNFPLSICFESVKA